MSPLSPHTPASNAVRAASPKSTERLALLTALAGLEAASCVHIVHASLFRSRLRVFVEGNIEPLRARQLLVVATVLAGMAAAVWMLHAAKASEQTRTTARGWVRLLAPLVPLAPTVMLARAKLFDDRPMVVLVLVAMCALGMERAVSWGWRDATHLRERMTRPSRLWDAATATLAIGFFAWLASRSVRLHHKGLTSNYDLGLFENLFWNTMHGVHGTALDLPYFDQHAELILYPLSLIYRVLPYTETLLILQATALAGTCVPLYLLARHLLGPTSVAFVVPLVYASFPAVHGAAFYDFHFLALSPVFVAGAAFAFAVRRWRLFWPMVFGALLCREDVAIGLCVVSTVLFAAGRERRVTGTVAVASLVYFVLVKLVWMPPNSFLGYYAPLVAPGASGFPSVALTLLSNPLFVASKVLTEDKILLALHLFVPTLFLPVRRWRTTFLLLPGLIVVGLAASGTAITMVHFHYASHFTPYLWISVVLALAALPSARRLGAGAGLLVAGLLASAHFGAVVREPFKASFHEVSFTWTDADAQRFERTRAVAALIPDDASVAASEYEGPHVARRRHLRAIKDGIEGAEYVFFGPRGLAWGGAELVVAELKSGAVGVVHLDAEHTLLRRGETTVRNAEALLAMRNAGLTK